MNEAEAVEEGLVLMLIHQPHSVNEVAELQENYKEKYGRYFRCFSPGAYVQTTLPVGPMKSNPPSNNTTIRTGGVYLNTPYFSVARELVNDSTVQPAFIHDCSLLLSLLLSWLNYDLFKKRGWVLFGTDRMRCELRFKNKRLLDAIGELQKAGLIKVQPAGHGGLTASEMQTIKEELKGQPEGRARDYWHVRSVQSNSNVYRLGKGILTPSLPTFNPWDGRAKDNNEPEEAVVGDIETVGTSFPGPHGFKNGLNGGGIEADKTTLSEKEEEAFEYLRTIHTKIPEYDGPPIEVAEALSLVKQTPFPKISEICTTFLSEYQPGDGTWNPIGVLIYRLRGGKPRRRIVHTAPPRKNKPYQPPASGIDWSKYEPGGKYGYLGAATG